MKHRDHKTAARQPTRTELENTVHRQSDVIEARERQIASLIERNRDLQHRLDEIVKLARKP
jgi:cell fate (sporulation/competence/biofilm development) regulator YlbF (YheA/YmcA/DUF963 family)